MDTMQQPPVKIQADVAAPVQKVWEFWNEPQHITQWNCASDDWHSPRAENDLREGGSFSIRMEAKDGSFGFDFGGIYDVVRKEEYIEYTMSDGRKVTVTFKAEGNSTHIDENFEPETSNPVEMQRQGWQAILDNFRKYAEANA